MDDYNFWRDFFDTYQSLPDWMKFAWLVVPPAFLLGLAAILMRYQIATKRAEFPTGNLAYTVIADENGRLRIYRNDGADALPTGKPMGGVLPSPGAQPRPLAKPPLPDV